ncbi:MAG: hypothetical protein NTV23_03160 [Propionibacteriales bacterium]|nr:hypothetical protein [Propionibacteriales bacterium]
MNALISRLQAPRTIRSHVARLLVVRTVGSVVLVATALFGQSLAMQPSGADLEAGPVPATVRPVLDRVAYPDCVRPQDWPANTWGASVIAYSATDGRTRQVSFDRAWEVTHNDTEADDVTVLGICR